MSVKDVVRWSLWLKIPVNWSVMLIDATLLEKAFQHARGLLSSDHLLIFFKSLSTTINNSIYGSKFSYIFKPPECRLVALCSAYIGASSKMLQGRKLYQTH